MSLNEFVHGLYEHYFTSTLTTSDPLFDKALWPFAIGSVLAFLTIGLNSITIFNTSLPIAFFLIGLAGYIITVIAHIVLFILGSFYQRGVVKSVGIGILGVCALIAMTILAGIALYGGIAVGAFIFLSLLPIETILVPFNFIGFLVVSVWWYAKGLKIIDEGNSVKNALEPEINFIQKHLTQDKNSNNEEQLN